MNKRERELPKLRFFNEWHAPSLVRDEGVAGSNPATPTNITTDTLIQSLAGDDATRAPAPPAHLRAALVPYGTSIGPLTNLSWIKLAPAV